MHSWQEIGEILNAQVDHKRLRVKPPWERKAPEPGHPEALQDNKFPAMTSRRKPRRKGGNRG